MLHYSTHDSTVLSYTHCAQEEVLELIVEESTQKSSECHGITTARLNDALHSYIECGDRGDLKHIKHHGEYDNLLLVCGGLR